MEKSVQNFKVQQWVTGLSIVLFLLKIVAYYQTHSLTILSDALESIVNIVAGFIGLYSLYVAAKPKDVDHPYGHGKAEFISAAAEGSLIIGAGIVIVYETVHYLLEGGKPAALDSGMWLVSLTALANAAGGWICVKVGKKNQSLALESSGRHLLLDTFSTLAVLGTLLLIYLTHWNWLDWVVALCMAAWIMFNGYQILRRSLAGIMDEADQALLVKMVALVQANKKPMWIDLHNLRVIRYGNLLHVDCHLTLPWYLNIHQAHQEVDALSQLIQTAFGDSVEFFVHSDGCMPFSCSICTKTDCTVRQSPFEKQLDWTLDNVLSNQKHRMGHRPAEEAKKIS